MIPFLFFLFAIVAIASAVMMILHRNPIYCALFLIITMFSVAGLYVLLHAPFIAAVHVIVYAGAIIVLFLFVVMLLDLKRDQAKERSSRLAQVAGFGLAIVLFVQLGTFLTADGARAVTGVPDSASGSFIGDTASVGRLLFTEYLFPFEITSVLLFSAIIGAVILARQKLK